MSIVNDDGRRRRTTPTDGQTLDHEYPISSPRAFGSGELKIAKYIVHSISCSVMKITSSDEFSYVCQDSTLYYTYTDIDGIQKVSVQNEQHSES